MEKEKRRREALGEGRVDAETVITELLESVDLDKVVQEADDAESEYSTFWVYFWNLHEFQHYTINEIKSYPLLYDFSFRTTVIRRKRWDSDI